MNETVTYAVLLDGKLLGQIPAQNWPKALLALGATGGFERHDTHYTAMPMPRYRGSLVRTLKRLSHA